MTGIGATTTAVDRLTRILYGTHLHDFYTRHCLLPASELAFHLDSVEAGIVIAATADLVRDPAANVMVTVAPAVGRAPGQLPHLARLRLDWLAHLAIGITTATQLGARCLVYLPVGEQLPAATAAGRTAWHRLGEHLELLARYMAKDLADPPEITVIGSHVDDVRHRLDRAAARHSAWLTDATTADIHRVRGAHLPTAGARERRLMANRYAVLRHLPEVLADITGNPTEHVIAVGRLSDAPAAALARRIAATNPRHRVDLIAYMPAPNLTGTTTMTNAIAATAFTLGEDTATTRTKLRHLTGHQRTVWCALWQLHNQALSAPTDPGLTAMITYYRHLYDQARVATLPGGDRGAGGDRP